jgi:hypothetical protein
MDRQTMRVQRLQGLSADHRGSVRYPVDLELRYSVAGPGPVENGFGRTIDVSSSGLSFTADTPLSIGQRLDVSIDWPCSLTGASSFK